MTDLEAEGNEVPIVVAKLPDGLRRLLLAALPAEECTVLSTWGFEDCSDTPELPEHRYAEGYFHAASGAAYRTEFSIHPRSPANLSLSHQRRPAPLAFAAFCEVFRQRNAAALQRLGAALRESGSPLSAAFDRGAHFADLSVQLNWGCALPEEHASWHTDSHCSLLQLALGLQGRRTLLADRHLRHSVSMGQSPSEVQTPDEYEALPQAEGAVYLSAPCLFRHAVHFPEASWDGRIVSVQCRFLLQPSESSTEVKAELERSPLTRRAVLAHLRHCTLSLPSLEEVREQAARLASVEQSIEQLLSRRELQFEALYGCGARGGTALHSASERGHVGVVRSLLDNDLFRQSSAKDDFGDTALHAAAHEGHPAVAGLLLDHPSFGEANARNLQGLTALHTATLMGHLDIVKLLLGHLCFRAADAGKDSGGTALHAAAETGRCKIAKVLLGHPRFTAANAVDRDGRTALHSAAGHGKLDVLQLLLEHPHFTALHARQTGGWTALHLAAEYGQAEAVKALLDHRLFPEVDAKDANGNTALHRAAAAGRAGALRALLEHPRFEAVDAKNAFGGTALHVAVRSGNLEGMRMLLSHVRFTMTNAKNNDGNTPLHFAAKYGFAEGVKTLLEHSCFTKPKTRNNAGQTALDMALDLGHDEVTGVFAERGHNSAGRGARVSVV